MYSTARAEKCVDSLARLHSILHHQVVEMWPTTQYCCKVWDAILKFGVVNS